MHPSASQAMSEYSLGVRRYPLKAEWLHLRWSTTQKGLCSGFLHAATAHAFRSSEGFVLPKPLVRSVQLFHPTV